MTLWRRLLAWWRFRREVHAMLERVLVTQGGLLAGHVQIFQRIDELRATISGHHDAILALDRCVDEAGRNVSLKVELSLVEVQGRLAEHITASLADLHHHIPAIRRAADSTDHYIRDFLHAEPVDVQMCDCGHESAWRMVRDGGRTLCPTCYEEERQRVDPLFRIRG